MLLTSCANQNQPPEIKIVEIEKRVLIIPDAAYFTHVKNPTIVSEDKITPEWVKRYLYESRASLAQCNVQSANTLQFLLDNQTKIDEINKKIREDTLKNIK